MSKEAKSIVDAKIYADVKFGMTKTAAAKKYGTSARSVGRAIERHLASGAKPKKAKAVTETQVQYYEMKEGEPVVVAPVDDLEIGDTVVISRESAYEESESNPRGVTGIVNSVDVWVGVDWSNGLYNAYPNFGRNDLLLLASEEVKEADSAGWECDEDCTVLVTEDSTVLEALRGGIAVEYINTSSSVVLTLNNETEIVEETHPNFKEIQIAIVSGEFAKAFELMNIRKSIESFTRGAVSIKGDKLFYGNVEIKSSIVERILDLMRAGDEGFKTLVAFFEKLMENPSRDSVEQLWGFISHNDIEIDSEGYIIGWKKVRELEDGSLVDSRTKKVPNDIGNRVSMPRWMVDADKHVTCSQGLHVGAIGYVRQFSGDTIIKVRVHPRDVVSVPVDYHDQKMRVSAYGVLCKADSDCKELPVDDFGRINEDVVVGAAGELISRKPL